MSQSVSVSTDFTDVTLLSDGDDDDDEDDK